jgi:hypothetical protein
MRSDDHELELVARAKDLSAVVFTLSGGSFVHHIHHICVQAEGDIRSVVVSHLFQPNLHAIQPDTIVITAHRVYETLHALQVVMRYTSVVHGVRRSQEEVLFHGSMERTTDGVFRILECSRFSTYILLFAHQLLTSLRGTGGYDSELYPDRSSVSV